MKILLDISYLGTNYCGWQVQPNGITVQEKMQDAAEAVFGFRYDITGCSRTDSGVHANTFYCTISLDERANKVPIRKIARALNANLPKDIAVMSAKEVSEDFHPRYSIRGKEYKYLIWNGRYHNPFFIDRACFYPTPLDVSLMNDGAQKFIGRHDFAAFMSSGSNVTDTVREVYTCEAKRSGDFIEILISADGFLYNMVRIIAGTLIYISEGKIRINDIDDIINSRDRKRAGKTMPPEGLYLNKILL